jgi:DNA replication protein DnaC
MKLKCNCGKTWTTDEPTTSPDYEFNRECQPCKHARLVKRFAVILPMAFTDTDPAKLRQDTLKQAMAWKYGRKGLVMIGETGLGKTRTAWLLLRRVLVDDGRDIKFAWFKDITFGQELGIRYRNETAEEWLQGLAKVPLLFIDDIGKMKLTDRAESELFGIIDQRCENGLPMIVTTNDTGESLKNRMDAANNAGRGAPLVRRLREFCEQIKF